MALTAGARLGPYEIGAQVGVGGMGEVYRARDTRLDRTVAIKVLAGDLAADSEFRQRFHTEARAISQLTHPHICTLHDIGEHEGTIFLVMELVTGETLADRLARGTAEHPAVPLDHALQIGIQIADALAAAHAQGIVHRDLKPGNVMLTKAATGSPAMPHAKLLDFGLAKATPVVMSSGLSMAATTPPQAVTAQGAILGTIQYMAPEQVEGGVVDARSDIFAFGSVMYELLTGRRAFEGKTQAGLMAAILEREPPPLSALQPRAPALVDETVKKCLAKDPGDRWQSAADVATALRWATSGLMTVDRRIADQRARGRVAGAVAIAAAAAAAGVSLGWVASRSLSDTIPTPEALVFEVPPPPNGTFSPSPVASAAQLALSPDGRRLAFVAAPRRGASRIWVRRLDSLQAQPLAGTEGATFPFWSPDGRALAFFADGKLKKIDLAGGAPEPLADARNARGGSWSSSGEIVFTPSPINPLLKVSSAGGPPVPETTLSTVEGATQHYWPQFLPNGRQLLYYQRSSAPEHQGIYVKTLGSSDARRVLRTDGMALYTPGYLLFVRDGLLFAVSFDDQTLEVHGDPIRLADGVGFFGAAFGYVTASASATGALAYGPGVVMTTNLEWRSRAGAIVGTPTRPNVYRSPRLSPDESSVAFSRGGAQDQGPDIYVLELTRGGLSRVTSSPGNDWFPAWTPDGTKLYFASTRAGPSTLFQKPLGGAGDGEAVTAPSSAGHYPTDVSPNGGLVVSHQITTASGGYDIVVVPDGPARSAVPFLVTPFNEVQARISPNGRWIAYASDESGRFEIYVRSFPTPGPQVPISVNGGMQPEWRRDGRELFFASADGKLMAVDVVTAGVAFTGGIARALFDIEIPEPLAPYPTDYAVSTDGQRFFINTIDYQPTRPSLTVILNWAAGLKRN